MLVVLCLAIVAWSLKGRGCLYALKLRLGLIQAPRQQPALSGSIPANDRSGRIYPPVDPDLRFEKVSLPAAAGIGYTCVAIGPDGRLWACSDDGRIFAFAINRDGTAEPPEVFTPLQRARGGPRLLTGFCFDSSAPPEEPVLYLTHSEFAFSDAREWSGAITRLSGPQLESVQDLVVGLPRSVGDHATNQPVFGPDGALYIPQAGNTASGDADETWGDRPERLLSASILRLDLLKLPAQLPLNAQTEEGANYDPFAPGAALTVYATGVRLAYDLCWTDDGHLYAAINGASPGGNVPAAPDGSVPALRQLASAEPDWLVRIKPGGYYGHPNPRQGHFVLNGGNPTAAQDTAEVAEYRLGTLPDQAWEPPIADLGLHQSADGIIQYRAAGTTPPQAKLHRTLILCRYSFGGDLIAVRLTPAGDVAQIIEGIPGFTDFANPLDVTQDPRTGFLYVSDYGAKEIVLVRHVATPEDSDEPGSESTPRTPD